MKRFFRIGSGVIASVIAFVLIAAYLAAGLYGVVLTEQVLWREWGWLGIILGNLFFPVAVMIVPFFEGLANGDWTLIWLWGVGIAFFVILIIVELISN